MNESANLSIVKKFRLCIESSNDVNQCMKDAVKSELDARVSKYTDSQSLINYMSKLLVDALLENEANEDTIKRLRSTQKA